MPIAQPDAIAALKAFAITSTEQQTFATNLVKEIKAQWSALEEQRKKITKPLNEALRQTNAMFKPVLEALQEGEAVLKQKLADYVRTQERANEAALEAVKQAQTQQQAQQILATVAPVAAPQGVSIRQVWKFSVTDPNAVPRELCSPDAKKISAAFRLDANGQPILVPGVSWYQEDSVAVRGR